MNFDTIVLRKNKIDDFASERNKLMSKSKSKWVLFLDSDEKLVGNLRPTINSFAGYYLRRKNYFLGNYVGEDKIIRYAQRDAGKWVRRVHETWEIDGRVGKLNKPVIIHNTADNLMDYLGKLNLYSSLHAQANKEEGKRVNVIQIIFFPSAKFFETLVKSKNVVFAIMQSFHSFLSWSKLYFLRF